MAVRGEGAETRAVRARAYVADSCPRPSHLFLAGPQRVRARQPDTYSSSLCEPFSPYPPGI